MYSAHKGSSQGRTSLMAYIRHIPPSQACGRLAHVYREIRAEVPRVPNLMQVFSLRPETMESVYRLWLASMWNGQLSRQSKEMLAVVVSRAANCEYCADTHLVFLQAAGMDRAAAWDIEQKLSDAASLSEEQRLVVQFATRLTVDPRGVGADEVASFTSSCPSRAEQAESLAVIAEFNTITRIANALGVSFEIPDALRRFESGRRGAISLLSRLSSLSLDMNERPVRARTPEDTHQAADRLFLAQLGFPEQPAGLSMLEACPESFDCQLAAIEKSVAVLPRDRWMRIGLVVGRLTGSEYFSRHCASWLEQRGTEITDVIAASEGATSTLPEAEQACLRFSRDLTLHSHTIGQDRIHELRDCGLSDGAILDLAYGGGIFNGLVRLVQVLAHLDDCV